MTSAEQAVRRQMMTLLTADADLASRVHGIFDGTPPRATAPYVSIGGAEGSDWGTKDRAGREVRVTATLVGVGDSAAHGAVPRIEAAANGLRGATAGWEIVSARVMRTRFIQQRDGGWRHDVMMRCRCLMMA